MLRTPYCLDSRLTDGSEIVSVTRWQRSIPQKYPLVLISVGGEPTVGP
jgi:hypothetical protein